LQAKEEERKKMNKLPTCEEERINEIGHRSVYLV